MAEMFYFQKRKKKKTKIFFFLFFVLISGVFYLIVFSPVFRIKQIKIEGAFKINQEELIADLKTFILRSSKMSQFLGTENILSWPRDLNGFTEDHPFIEEISCKKSFFTKEIEIKIQEREKFGIWCLLPLADNNASSTEAHLFAVASFKTEKCWWFDKNGLIFAEAPSSEGFLIRKVNDYSLRELKVGDLVLAPHLFQNFLKIYEVLRKIDLKATHLLLENIDRQEAIFESTGDTPKIYFSLRFDPTNSFSAINTLKQDPGFEKLLYIDLRTENRAYYKMR